MLYALKKSTQFSWIRKAPALARTQHFLLQTQSSKHVGVGLGIVLPKRYARHAVTRNAIRRQVYRFMRARVQALELRGSGCWVLLRQRQRFSELDFRSACSIRLKKQIEQELRMLFTKI